MSLWNHLGKPGRAIKGLLSDDQFMGRLAQAQAFANGDAGTAAEIGFRLHDRKKADEHIAPRPVTHPIVSPSLGHVGSEYDPRYGRWMGFHPDVLHPGQLQTDHLEGETVLPGAHPRRPSWQKYA